MLNEPLSAPLKIRITIERVSGHGRRAKHGNKAHHSTGAYGDRFVLPRNQVVIEKSVLLIPERHEWIPDAIHGIGDEDVVLPEFAGNIFINGVLFGQQKGGSKHVFGESSHPACAIRLSKQVALRKFVAIEYTNVIHPQKSTLENIFAQCVLAVDPPGKVEEHLLKDTFQKCEISDTGMLALNLEHSPRRKRQNGWIDAIEIPFIGGDLPIGVHVPLTQHLENLFFGQVRVDICQGNTMKAEIPGCEPRKLPLVRH